MNQFCLETAAKLQVASHNLPEEVFSVYGDWPRRNGEPVSHEASETIEGKKYWLVFESEPAAKLWISQQRTPGVTWEVQLSHADTIEWLELLVLRSPSAGSLSSYIAISLVDGELKRETSKWVTKLLGKA